MLTLARFTTLALTGILLTPTLAVTAQDTEIYNNYNRFLRWRADNELVMAVENADPFYAAKIVLEPKNDENRLAQRFDYNPLTGQILAMNDYCVGVGGQYEVMLKDCEETRTHTLWNFDEFGRLVGSVNVTGEREAFCVESVVQEDGVTDMFYTACTEAPTQGWELEGTGQTATYNDILLYNDGQQQDSLFNVITTDQDLETLRDAIQALGAEQNLRNDSLAVFAPTDEAFAKLDPALVEFLFLPENQALLNELVAYHVTEAVSAETLQARAGIVNVTGDHLQLIDGKINGTANLVEVNKVSRNGLVHTIDEVLISPRLAEALR